MSLATMLAMVSVTGVAAAAFFGMSFGQVGKALTSSSQKVGTSTSQALRAPAVPSAPASSSAPAASSNAAPPAALGSPAASNSGIAGIASLAGIGSFRPSGGGAAPAAAAGPSANLIPGNLFNAGVFQYGPGRLVCRILRALGLRRIARLLGCP